MNRALAFSAALASATLGLTACGGGSNTFPVSCTPPTTTELKPTGTTKWATPCIASSTGSGSSRYDLVSTTTGCLPLSLTKMDFTDAACTTGASQSAVVYTHTFPGTTTQKNVATTANDASTPVSGSGLEIAFNKLTGPSSGTLASTISVPFNNGRASASVPFAADGNYIICKSSAPSTNAARTVVGFANSVSSSSTFTPAYALMFTVVGRTEVETNLKFDGPF